MRARSRVTRFLLGALLVAATLSPVAAQQAEPISITRNLDLGFGGIVVSGGAGSVTVAPNGSRHSAGGVLLGTTAGVAAASLTVSGEPDSVYSIVLPSSISLSSGGETMTVDGFASDPDGTGLLGPGGTQELRIGATLQVGAQQATGNYSGGFSVTVAYP